MRRARRRWRMPCGDRADTGDAAAAGRPGHRHGGRRRCLPGRSGWRKCAFARCGWATNAGRMQHADPCWIGKLFDEAAAHGISLLDAPVTEVVCRPRPARCAFSSAVRRQASPRYNRCSTCWLGDDLSRPPAARRDAEAEKQFPVRVQVAALAEAMVAIERSGLDVEAAFRLIGTGAPAAPCVNAVGDRMIQRVYTRAIPHSVDGKDLGYAERTMKEMGIESRMAAPCDIPFPHGGPTGSSGRRYRRRRRHLDDAPPAINAAGEGHARSRRMIDHGSPISHSINGRRSVDRRQTPAMACRARRSSASSRPDGRVDGAAPRPAMAAIHILKPPVLPALLTDKW